MSDRGHRRGHPRVRALLALGLAGTLLATGAIATNTLGAGDRWERVVARVALFLDPPPDRETRATIEATPRPRSALAAQSNAPAETIAPTAAPAAPASVTASPAAVTATGTPIPGRPTAAATAVAPAPTREPTPEPTREPTPEPTARPTPKPTPVPERTPVRVSIVEDPEAVFAHQIGKDDCAVAGTQMVLSILGLGDTSDAFQHQIGSRIDEWESWEDSHDGNWGPAAIAEALADYGEPGYEIRAYKTREDALLDAALAISETNKPVVLLTWRGAHTWVMTGYRASADPLRFDDVRITHAQILDPWYPWVSSIWGASDPPGHFENMAEMERNYLPWARPEGRYPGRDGRFIALVPTTPR